MLDPASVVGLSGGCFVGPGHPEQQFHLWAPGVGVTTIHLLGPVRSSYRVASRACIHMPSARPHPHVLVAAEQSLLHLHSPHMEAPTARMCFWASRH